MTGNHITAPAINNPTAKRSFLWRLFHTKKPITINAMVRPPIITPSAIWAISAMVTKDHRFDLRFLLPLRADLSIRKSSSFFAATSQRGFAPRPAQVSPEGLRYFGGTFLPLNALPPPRPTPPTTAILSNCFSISVRRQEAFHQFAFAGP